MTSDNDVAHNNLGYLCADRGELMKPFSHFESAARIRSGKTNQHYDAGSAFMEMNLADTLPQKVAPTKRWLITRRQSDWNHIMQMPITTVATFCLRRGRIDEAIADWEWTLQLRPDDADAHTCLGNALLRQGSLKEAIAHYEIAVALAPEDPHSRNNIAWTLATSSDDSIRDGAKAVDFAQQAVTLSGGRDLSFSGRSALLMRKLAGSSEAIAAADKPPR